MTEKKQHLVLGIVAHVDAGKTTLSERILYETGRIRKLGRVDHRDTFLDTDAQERARGITIFSKQANFSLGETEITLLDTPGHVDFSAETERTLSVLDYAVLLVSAADGVQGHVQTLWRLLQRYEVPTLIFVNKMDQPGADRAAVMEHLREKLGECCVDFSEAQAWFEKTLRCGDESGGRQNGKAPRADAAFLRCIQNAGERAENAEKDAAAGVKRGTAGNADTSEGFSFDARCCSEAFLEAAAVSDEALLEQYLSDGALSLSGVQTAVRERRLMPCCFGSALKGGGVASFLALSGLLMREETGRYKKENADAASLSDSYGFFANRKERLQTAETVQPAGTKTADKCAAENPEPFGARVYKITRDAQGNRLTHVKITSGTLRAKETVAVRKAQDAGRETDAAEKVDAIRLYDGQQFEPLQSAERGMVVALSGLTKTAAGDGLGAEEASALPLLMPLFSYAVRLPFDTDVQQMYGKLKTLEEEIPELAVRYHAQTGEIHLKLMGDVQTEVLKELIRTRFGTDVSFGGGEIVYMETIGTAAEGVGHFEPLRHYAEVHLLLEPAERGSGIHVESLCSEDVLARNDQRLILSMLEERVHAGILTGSELTDVTIKLLSGKAHEKHTEGGDFREAAWRAVRHGLMRAKPVLLEPYYSYQLRIPAEYVGRAMTDLSRMQGNVPEAEHEGALVLFRGRAPVSRMRGYQTEVLAYTKGFGQLSCSFCGYDVCPEQEAAAAASGYDPESDLEQPSGSVFCAHGAGFYVPWQEVERYMHLPYSYGRDGLGAGIGDANAQNADGTRAADGAGGMQSTGFRAASGGSGASGKTAGKADGGSRGHDYMGAGYAADRELEAIFLKTFGTSKREQARAAGAGALVREQTGGTSGGKKTRKTAADEGNTADPRRPFVSVPDKKHQYLLVDGYNIIFAWEELRELSKINIDSARLALMDILSNYQGYLGVNLILVFDAYKVHGGQGEVQRYHNIYVVYTREAETADQYIEKTVHDMDGRYRVTVATSDGLEQMIVFGEGAARMSARELCEAVGAANEDLRERFLRRQQKLENRMELRP